MSRNTFVRFNPTRYLAALCAAAALMLAIPGYSFLNQYTGKSADRWDFGAFPVQYSINPSVGSNVHGGSAAAVAVIQASFTTWDNAPNAAVNVTYAGASSATSKGTDGVNLICFICKGDFSKDSTTLAVTWTTTADAVGEDTGHGTRSTFVGQILDADILFNPSVEWTTNGTPTDPQEDLQTVATHEIGHFLGLDHSGVVRAVMYPFAPPLLTTLGYDDVAAVASVYPKANPDFATGAISGTVKFTGGSPVFGAHVFADSLANDAPLFPNIRKTPVSALTRADGSYTIVGLPAGNYTVGAEPLDLPVSNSDIKDYSKNVGNRDSVDTKFNTRWH